MSDKKYPDIPIVVESTRLKRKYAPTSVKRPPTKPATIAPIEARMTEMPSTLRGPRISSLDVSIVVDILVPSYE